METGLKPPTLLFPSDHSIEHLVLGLNLVVSGDNVGVGRRYALVIRAAALAVICDALLLLGRRVRRAGSVLGTVVHVSGVARVGLGLRLWLLVVLTVLVRTWWALDVDVGDAVALAILGQRLIFVGWLGILGDQIPCVNEAGNVAKTAEEDVDKRISTAETALDPYRQWGEENGKESEEEVGGTHCCAIGRKNLKLVLFRLENEL